MFQVFNKQFFFQKHLILLLLLASSLLLQAQSDRKFHYGVYLSFVNEHENLKDVFSFKKSNYQAVYGLGIEPGLAISYQVSKKLYLFGLLGYNFAKKYNIDSTYENVNYDLTAKHRMIRLGLLPYIPLFNFNFLDHQFSFSVVGEVSYNIIKYRYYDNEHLLLQDQNNNMGYGGGFNLSIGNAMVFFRFVKIGKPIFVSTNLFILF